MPGKKWISIILCSMLLVVAAEAKKAVRPTERAIAFNNQGAALLSDNRLSEAEFQLKTAVQLSPDYAEAYNNLGIVYKKQARYQEALDHFEKAYKLDKRYLAPLSHTGAVYIDQGKYDAAIKVLKKAVRKDPTFTYAVYNLGFAYLLSAREAHTGKSKDKLYEKSEKQLLIATQLNPHFFEAHVALADLYAETGQLESASIRYRLAIQDNRANSAVYLKLAALEEQRGNTAEAKRFKQQAGKVKSQSALQNAFDEGVKYAAEGESLRAAGKNKAATLAFTNAAAAFHKALKYDRTNIAARYGLGVVYSRLGKHSAAREAWEQVLRNAPKHPGALFNLGTLAFQQGKTSEGQYLFCEFVGLGGYQFAEQQRIAKDYLRESKLSCRN